MSERRLGYIYGFGAYLCWGILPLFYVLLVQVDSNELVPWRVVLTLFFCVIAMSLVRRWGGLLAILRSPRLLGWFALCGALLYANWMIFVTGIITGHVIEAALGYFINPIITILIGVVVRKERLRPAQWVAVVLAGVGVLISAIAYGQFPFIALGLALTFGIYGAVRKQVSEDIDALTGLTIETMLALPLALVQFGVLLALHGRLAAFDFGPVVTIALLSSGVITGIPLILFAAGTRRLPLSHMGFLQFIAPILGFLTGYLLLGEEMPPVRWIGFIAVWVALVVLVSDMVVSLRASRRAGAGGSEPPAVTGEITAQPAP